MEDAPRNQELKTVERKFINAAVLAAMEASLKLDKEALQLAENIYGINDENVISLRAFVTEKETILPKIQTKGLITEEDFDSFFDPDRMKEIGLNFKIEAA